MAFTNIEMKNPISGEVESAPVGFSWTTLFFQFLVPMFRGHWSAFFIQIAILFPTLGISQFIVPFLYNKWYVKYLLSNGYQSISADDHTSYVGSALGLPIPVLAK